MILYERDILRMEEVKSYIDQNLDKDLDRRMLATLFSISSATLDRHFFYCNRITLARFVKKQRMEKAMILLLARSLSVGEIANSVGFSDVSNFSHIFHNYFGRSPFHFLRTGTSGQIPSDKP